MEVAVRREGDLERLDELIGREKVAVQRDRLRAVRLALDGREALEIAATLGRSRRFVQEWAYAYRDGGVDTVQPKRRKGREPRLPREREAELMARLDAGPRPDDGGVCTLRGKDVVRILEREFLVKYTLAGAYELLERLGYSCLAPRPRHEKGDPAARQRFREHAPFLSEP